MIPLIAPVDVKRLTFFHRFGGQRIAAVDKQEGIAHDRPYSEAELFGLLIDVGGYRFFRRKL